MGRILFVGTFGSDDPTRATFPFLSASGALDAGHEAVIFLTGEATYLMKDEVMSAVQGIGIPPVSQLMEKVVNNGVPIYV